MDQWRQPDRQHDMAEYLVFLTTCPLVNFQRVTLHWQARTAERDGRVRISDIGHSVPLVLLPPCTKAWIVFLLSPCRIWCFSGIRSMILTLPGPFHLRSFCKLGDSITTNSVDLRSSAVTEWCLALCLSSRCSSKACNVGTRFSNLIRQ